MDAAPLRVGIVPAHEHTRRPRLWSALGDAYGVRFEGRADGATDGLDGVLVVGGEAAGRAGGATGEATREDATAAGGAATSPTGVVPRLLMAGEEQPDANTPPRALMFSRDPALSRPLHGARLSETHCAARALAGGVRDGEVVLATLDGTPAWTRAARDGEHGAPPTQRVACAPAELAAGEALRERLEPGRCLALLALAQFLGDLTGGATAAARGARGSGTTAAASAARAPLQAAFLIDDPNLHRPRYGHLRYAELLRDAEAHGYHLAVAMVPLDGWFADPRVARMFRAGAARLSVCVHGNEHYGPELGRPRTVAEGVALGRRALRRVAAFERRTGVAVDRVMVPPHERIGEPMARALVACGFQALCTTRPYPWAVNSPELPWLTRPADAGPLAAWRPADIVAGGLPVLLRADFARHPREDLVLRAFLGQPLILYGHHELLRDGPDALARAAAEIDALGEVRWGSLAEIARACVLGTAISDPALPDPATIPLQPRRLRPILRRVAAEGEVRLRAAVAR
ncbi:MAG TPA: hypothetical protein VK756_00600 [Solirubrobacteraceae bacterium]|jgi:hypothetical protein|nr:hypothetical protein [Solirubrobacteraceae bacterium]